MSGTFTYRVNRYWDSSTNSIAPAVFFWEWLHWINDHAGMVFKGYGTGKVASGITPPSAWLNWDPLVTPAPPMSDNSWFVWEASNADPLLNGAGSTPWQAKIQFTLATGFDDCNVADTDYTQETATYVVCLRVSPEAGWDNTVALDFAPIGGEDISDNFRIFEENLDGKFVLDFIGDDDTFWWVGACYDGLISEALARARGGHIGLLQQQSLAIENPFLLTAGRISDITTGGGYDAVFGSTAAHYYVFGDPYVSMRWPSFSLWHDGTKIESHAHDSWDTTSRARLDRSEATNEVMVLGMLVGTDVESKKVLIGEYRFMGATGFEFTQRTLTGDSSDWIQICYDVPNHPGVLMQWPPGVVPIW